MGDRKEARDTEFQSFFIGRWPRLLRTAFLLTGGTARRRGPGPVDLRAGLRGLAQGRLGGLTPGSRPPLRLVIGRIAKTAQEVTCVWKDGTSSVLHRVAGRSDNGDVKQGIRTAEGSTDRWFVCLAPKGTAYQDARVTGLTQ